ncbi:hypothetical protein [Nocardiopsis sp. NRRL B-16309]|uniref:hypothetical protein n=1 Tax=Nocardiopsis sp. NRRL B-16309 TaxID=1519494 RepID=UPI0009EBFBB1|nr:hypothetical protein [Nocardiopsis sp. NRRL B-16309]
MDQPNGRHRRPHRTLAEQVWNVAATLLAAALMFVFVPRQPHREQFALPPLPQRRPLPAPHVPIAEAGEAEPDESPGPLVRPYMPPPPPLRPFVPRPRAPEGDLLAASPTPALRRSSDPDDLSDLTAAIRAYLAMTR